MKCDRCGVEQIIIKPSSEIIRNGMRYISAEMVSLPGKIKCNRKGCKTTSIRCLNCFPTCNSCENFMKGQIMEVITSFDKINPNKYDAFQDVRNIIFEYLFV